MSEGVTCAVRDCANLSWETGKCKLNSIFITEKEHKCRDYKKKVKK